MEKIENVNLIYQGPSVSKGEIDVEDLAYGLIGYNNCYNEIKKIINNNETHKLKIKSFKQGSFLTEIVTTVINKQGNFLIGTISITVIIAAFIWLIIKTKGQKIKNFSIGPKGLEIEFQDKSKKSSLAIPSEFKDILNNPIIIKHIINNIKIQQSISKIIIPIKENEINSFTLEAVGERVVKQEITHKEKEYFSNINEKTITTKKTNLNGIIRAWDKKTNNGKFIYNNLTCSCSFEMENAKDYYHFFSKSEEEQVQVECEVEMNEEFKIDKITIFDIKEINKE